MLNFEAAVSGISLAAIWVKLIYFDILRIVLFIPSEKSAGQVWPKKLWKT